MAEQNLNAFAQAYGNIADLNQIDAKQKAGGLLANGNVSGAQNALYRAGDIAGGQQVQTYSDTQRKQHAEAAQRIASGIRAMIQAGHQPGEAYDAATMMAPQLGVDPNDLAKMRPAFDKDPKAFLDFVDQQSKQELQAANLGNGGFGSFNPRTGELKILREPQYEQKYATVPEGGKLVPIPRGNQPPATVDPYSSGQGVTPTAPGLAGAPQEVVAPLTGLGARVTSGTRTPQHNAEVGGVPNSRHITGQAADLVPPQGMTLAQLGEEAKRRLPGAKVIIESDHVHVQWGGPAHAQPATPSGDPPGTIYGAPKPRSDGAPSGYRWNGDKLEPIPGGPADPATKTSAGFKQVPAKVQSGYADNAKSMTQIDEAIAAIRADGGALGGSAIGFIRNRLGDNVAQRTDPGGVGTRASVANIGSLIIHDRSGAAVTAAEQPRLMPFIPQVTDTPEAAITKLQTLRRALENANSEIEVQFGEDSGYRPMGGVGRTSTTPAASAQRQAPPAKAQASSAALPPKALQALKPGHVTTFANGQGWTLENGQPKRVK